MHLVPAIAAVLLALAGHAVHQRFLGAVVEGVEGGVKEALEGRLAGVKVRLIGPGKDTAPHPHIADEHRAFGVMNVQLQPAQALEVEGLEFIVARRGR